MDNIQLLYTSSQYRLIPTHPLQVVASAHSRTSSYFLCIISFLLPPRMSGKEPEFYNYKFIYLMLICGCARCQYHCTLMPSSSLHTEYHLMPFPFDGSWHEGFNTARSVLIPAEKEINSCVSLPEFLRFMK